MILEADSPSSLQTRDQAGQYLDFTLAGLRVGKIARSIWISENILWDHKLVVIYGNSRKHTCEKILIATLTDISHKISGDIND